MLFCIENALKGKIRGTEVVGKTLLIRSRASNIKSHKVTEILLQFYDFSFFFFVTLTKYI